ncbi:MAG: L,D-transpeptidase [Chthoniobacterales bacterium]
MIALLALVLTGCAGDTRHEILVSVRDQRMVVLDEGTLVAAYPVSTSKFGTGSTPGSNRTPLGNFKVREKLGTNLPPGAVLKDRRPTGEILPVNAPGRDPIVSRILWLDGKDAGNRNTRSRYIYIHGTPEERTLGTPASFGCIRMGSNDVIALYDRVGSGARVQIRESF